MTCERCKQPLLNDVAIPGHDGRMICSRTGCQHVEEMCRRIEGGTLELVDPSEFATEVKFPVEATLIDDAAEAVAETVAEKARLMIQEVQAAVSRGTRHFDPETGRELKTLREILVCLRDRGGLRFEPRES